MRSQNSPIDIDLTVRLSLSGTAQNGLDYSEVGNSLVIPAGQLYTSVIIKPREAIQAQGSQTIVLNIEPGEDYSVALPGAATVLLQDPGLAPRFRHGGTTILSDGRIRLLVDSLPTTKYEIEISADLK